MKFGIIFAVLIATVLTEEIYTKDQLRQLKAISDECEESNQVEHEKLVQFRQKHFHDDDQHLKDYMFCLLKKADWMTDCGHLKMDTVRKTVHKDKHGSKAVEQCMDEGGNNGPEIAYNFYKCCMLHLPDDYKYHV